MGEPFNEGSAFVINGRVGEKQRPRVNNIEVDVDMDDTQVLMRGSHVSAPPWSIASGQGSHCSNRISQGLL